MKRLFQGGGRDGLNPRCGGRARQLTRFALGVLWLMGAGACGADAPLRQNAGSQSAEAAGDAADPAREAARELEDLGAPGYVAQPYPAPPYGRAPGSVIENLPFLGWPDPAHAAHDPENLVTLSLADFYDPEGERAVELIFVNAIAVWCSVCRLEYDDLRREAYYERMRPRGLEMLGVLFEDNQGGSPTLADLAAWSAHFEVDFPFVIDPGFKTSVFFDRAATPMNMLIDARTMEILSLNTGYSAEMFDEIEALLEARGR